MRQITLKIPESKYQFFVELIKNLGLESVKDTAVELQEEMNKPRTARSNVAALRGKLQLTTEQHKKLHQHIVDERNEWERAI